MLHSDVEMDGDLCFKVFYVGHPENNSYDQELAKIWVGPIAHGNNKFEIAVNGPDHKLIPDEHFLGLNVILLIGYTELPDSTEDDEKLQEFVRVGYYVNVTDALAETTIPEPEGENLMDSALIDADRRDLEAPEPESEEPEGEAEADGDTDAPMVAMEVEMVETAPAKPVTLVGADYDVSQVMKLISESPVVKYVTAGM